MVGVFAFLLRGDEKMSFILEFARPHLSIKTFPNIELPDFSLITGLNGTGKTHLLRAIAEGYIRCRVGDVKRTGPVDAYLKPAEIRYFDWNSLRPAREPESSPESDHRKSLERWEIVRSVEEALSNARKEEGELESRISGRASFLKHHRKLTWEEAEAHARSFAITEHALRYVEPNRPAAALLKASLREQNQPAASLSRQELQKLLPLALETVDVFQQSFADLFVGYRDRKQANDHEQLGKMRGEPEAAPLSDEEFVAKYGIPPWDFVNQTFENAGIDFAVVGPNLYDLRGHYSLELVKRSTGERRHHDQLSSGEKVLMAFAHCLYYTQDSRQTVKFPKLLLLDEVDAPLHPSMSKQVLRTITECLVKVAGVKVIATTHSATTVALAPDESLFVMNGDWPGLRQTTRNKALGVLLNDVPMIALDYSGRRQVFVESPTDEDLYSRIYQMIRGSLDVDRSLIFMAAGTRDSTGDRGNGSDSVKRVVNVLREAGNQSVFGVVDWDNANEPTNRVEVLAYGERDGIENCILDPLVLAIVITREKPSERERIGISIDTAAHKFREFSRDKLQEVADRVQELVMGVKPCAERIACSYEGGQTLQLRCDYLRLDDHDLETKIKDTFLFLRRDKLTQFVVERYFEEYPDFIPSCFRALFVRILKAQA